MAITATRRARRAVGAIGVGAGLVLFRPGSPANRAVRHQIDVAGRRLRDIGGRLRGLSYRLKGGRPDPSVSDLILADRIRSSLGTVEKRLDVPHVHVMVEDHVVLLHGVVGTEGELEDIERAVAAVSGVVGVESYLHVGLDGGDTRPSKGRQARPPSEAKRRLIEAATEAGINAGNAAAAIRAVLATFADRLPVDERDQVAAHLPGDVRALFTPPRRTAPHAAARTAHELVAAIAASDDEVPHELAQRLTAAVLTTLRQLVPEEAADVGAVLPPELRRLWRGEEPTKEGSSDA
jgi:uncharacterized protein (DUF2267 family)